MHTPEQEIEQRETELLSSRVRVGLIAWIGAGVLFVFSDLWLGAQTSAGIHLARLSNFGAIFAYYYLRKPRPRRVVEHVALAATLLGVTALALSVAAAKEPSGALILSSVMVLGAATILPWRFRCQAIAVAVALPALAVALAVVKGDALAAVSEPMLGVAASMFASLYIARVLERQRHLTNQATAANLSDGEVTATLARVGRELIASLDQPELLQRLCALSAEVLDCDTAYTFLIDDEGSIDVAAGFGYRPEEWETLRSLPLSAEAFEPLAKHLRRSSFAYRDFSQGRRAVTDVVNGGDPITMGLYFALRKGDDLVGFQAAAYRRRHTPPTLYEIRVARGLSDLASLALATARLVEELEAANHFQSDFLANMSHELRTPLNVIIGYSEMLTDGAYGDISSEQRATVEHISKAAQGQLALIAATLQLSRFESSDTPLEMYDIDLAALLEELEREARLVACGDSLRLTWSTPRSLPSIRTDSVKLKMVLKNLIDNAIKFTDRGEVAVRTRREGAGVSFTVEDTGPGIPSEAFATIFEAFRQHNSPVTQGRGGVGIGLYLVKRLVEALGGTLHLESEVGRGTTFDVWIPDGSEGQAELSRSA